MATILTSTTSTQVSAEVHSYVEHRAPDLHDAWANNSLTVFDGVSGQYITDVQVCTDRFKKVITLYTEKTNDRALKKFDLLRCHTWEDVQDTAAKAVAAFNAKENGVKGFLRKVGRKFGRASPAHQGWIQTLPCGDYSAVLCGALTLIFGAAARMSEIRTKILEALDCMPDALDIPEEYMKIYQNDPTLSRKAAELYMALLEAIEAMLDWLDHKAYKEVAKVFFTQAYYGTPIEKKLDAIQVRSAAFTRQVELCRSKREAQSFFLAKVNEVRGGVILDSVQATEEFVKENSIKLDSIEENTKDNSEALNSLTSMLKGQFSDLVKYAEWYALKLAREVTSQIAMQAAPPQPIITVDQLVPLLQVDQDLATRDADRSLREGNQLKPSDQQRAAWLMMNPKFQAWFKSGFSEMLVVDGMGEIIPVSPMSYFCALLSQELGNITNAVPLSYFCGLHRPGDSMSDATAIMRSLTTQLLTNPFVRSKVNLRFMSFNAIIGVQQFRLEYLCILFQRLVGCLNSNTAIFIILDGISWIETGPRVRDISQAVRSLRELVAECNTPGANGGAIVKLLITSPKASIHTKHLFPKESQLMIPNETLGNGQSFSARQMAMQQQRLLGSASSTSSQGSGSWSWMSNSAEGTPSRTGTVVGQNADYFRTSQSSQGSPRFGT